MHLFLMSKRSKIYIKESIYSHNNVEDVEDIEDVYKEKPHKYMNDAHSGFIP